MAEGEGFEPPVPFGTSVFKTDALNRSAIPPKSSTTLNFELLNFELKKRVVGAEGFEPPTVSSQS